MICLPLVRTNLRKKNMQEKITSPWKKNPFIACHFSVFIDLKSHFKLLLAYACYANRTKMKSQLYSFVSTDP